MGTWSVPNTKDKAEALAELLEKPLLKSHALDKLYHFLGDDDLFDIIECSSSITADSDVRYEVVQRLTAIFSCYADSPVEWDKEAVQICYRIVNQWAVNGDDAERERFGSFVNALTELSKQYGVVWCTGNGVTMVNPKSSHLNDLLYYVDPQRGELKPLNW